jgi:hypothetical protein
MLKKISKVLPVFIFLLLIGLFVLFFLNNNTKVYASGTTLTCPNLAYGVKNLKSPTGNIKFTQVNKAISGAGYINLDTYFTISLSPGTAGFNGQNCGGQNVRDNSNFQNIPSGSNIKFYEPQSNPDCHSLLTPGCHTYYVYNPIIPASANSTLPYIYPLSPPTTLNSSGVQNPLVGSPLNSPSGIVPFIFSIILPILYGIVGVIVLGLFSYAGFLLMVSNGDTNKVAKAKSVLTGAIIGASIILLAYVISLVLVHTV